MEENTTEEEGNELRRKCIQNPDPREFVCCLLQPPSMKASGNEEGAASDLGDYVGLRRLLIYRKSELLPAAIDRRKVVSSYSDESQGDYSFWMEQLFFGR